MAKKMAHEYTSGYHYKSRTPRNGELFVHGRMERLEEYPLERGRARARMSRSKNRLLRHFFFVHTRV